MQIDEFKRILTTFADTPTDIDLSKGELILQCQNNIIEAKLEFLENRDICITENNTKLPANEWIIKRLACLPSLAERILNYVKQEDNFVTPKGLLLDQLEKSPNEQEKDVPDALISTKMMLEKTKPGSSSILYLTSDAGEGKTTLINQLAREQAAAYKKKTTSWLLLPIPLGGRPFLRFDDMIVATLVNNFRFQFLYYDSFVELVRLGAVVPAFDGFEEMFMESSTGEAVSALGNLVRMLKSSGSVLISARKAYFEYKSFETQSRLFDSIGTEDVMFARLNIKRWDKENFLAYCSKRKVSDGGKIYDDVIKRFGNADHPLLTRAVLVRRLLDVATETATRKSLLERLGNKPHEYFSQFVSAILQREVNDKWIDRSSKSDEPAKALITVEEHCELLSNIAQEMWVNSVNNLREDLLDLVTELFCDKSDKNVVIGRQVKERIKQHALLIRPYESKPLYAFDHEDFRNYFLGRAIGKLMAGFSESELRNLLQVGPLPTDALDAAINYFQVLHGVTKNVLQALLALCASEGPTSFVHENIGGIIIRLIHGKKMESPITILGVSFPPQVLEGKELSGIQFERCYFQSTSTDECKLEKCVFKDCTFERLELEDNLSLKDVTLSDGNILSVVLPNSDTTVFAPGEIEAVLKGIGFGFPPKISSTETTVSRYKNELDLTLSERAFRRFLRSTTVSEDVLRAKMGSHANHFVKNVLPKLISSGIVKLHSFESSRNHYRLNIPMQVINTALTKSNGQFEEFLKIVKEKK